MSVTWTWGGSAIAGTSSLGAEWSVRSYRIAPIKPEPMWKPVRMLDANIEWGSARPKVERKVTLTILAELSGVSGSRVSAKCYDAWEELTEFFDPEDGVTALGATRKDVSNADVERELLVQVDEVPAFQFLMGQPGQLGVSGAYETDSGYIVYIVQGVTAFPYWTISTLLDEDTGAAAAELSVSGATDSVTINNPGVRWAGIEFIVKSGSMSGNVVGYTITNTTNNDELRVYDASKLAELDYFDWYASDPRKIRRTDTNVYVRGQGDKLRLDPGNNTLECDRYGAETGTCTLSLYWPSHHYTF